MVEAISETCRSVFRGHGRSASISSRWFTDVFSLIRDSIYVSVSTVTISSSNFNEGLHPARHPEAADSQGQ
jgi:hypothetical protein